MFCIPQKYCWHLVGNGLVGAGPGRLLAGALPVGGWVWGGSVVGPLPAPGDWGGRSGHGVLCSGWPPWFSGVGVDLRLDCPGPVFWGAGRLPAAGLVWL